MGRSKLPMEYITSEKARKSSFKKRKEGLVKKIRELSILCGIDACLIIYGPRNDDESPMEVHQWPNDSKEVECVLRKYELKRNESSSKHLNLMDFYGIQICKINEQITKTRREIAKDKFAKKSMELELENLSVDELKNMLNAVYKKIESVTSCVEAEKEKQKISRGIGAVELMKLDDENSNNKSHILDSSGQFATDASEIETTNEYYNAQTYLEEQVTDHFKPLHLSVSDFNPYLPLPSLTETFLTQTYYQTDLMAGYIPTFSENDKSEYAIGVSSFGQFQSPNWEAQYFQTSLYNKADAFKSYGMGYESLVGSYLVAQQQQQQQSVLTSVLQGNCFQSVDLCSAAGDCHCNFCEWQLESGTSDS